MVVVCSMGPTLLPFFRNHRQGTSIKYVPFFFERLMLPPDKTRNVLTKGTPEVEGFV